MNQALHNNLGNRHQQAGGRWLRLSALAAATALISACSLIPEYHRPALPVGSEYPVVKGDEASPVVSDTSKAAGDIDWRDYFVDPNIRQLIDVALSNNRDMRVAVLNIEAARAQYQIQRADLFPTIGAEASANRARSPQAGNAYANQYSVGLGVTSWELDFFGRVASLKEAALAQYLATEEGRKAAQISLVGAVAQSWFTLVADEELLKISRQTLSTREESVKLTKLRMESGVASELDYQQALSLIAGARATLALQERQLASDHNALVLLLGQSLPTDIRAKLPSLTLGSIPAMADVPAGSPSDLLLRRPDIRQAEQQLLSANANIGAARAAFFPRITLTGAYGSTSSQFNNLFSSGTWGYTVAPQAILPIFDWGRNRAGLDYAKATRDIAIAQYEKSIQTAFREVADALSGQATLGNQLSSVRDLVAADQRRFDLADLRYRNGVANYLDVLDSQRSLFQSQQQVVQSHLALLQNQVALYSALGGGFIEPAPQNGQATQAQQTSTINAPAGS